MAKLRLTHLIDEADELLDNKFHIGSYCLFMNTDDIQDILSKIMFLGNNYASMINAL